MIAWRLQDTIPFINADGVSEIDPALFEPPAEDAKDYEFSGVESFESVPFQYIGEHIYIMVNINGKERLWILDSGASSLPGRRSVPTPSGSR